MGSEDTIFSYCQKTYDTELSLRSEARRGIGFTSGLVIALIGFEVKASQGLLSASGSKTWFVFSTLVTVASALYAFKALLDPKFSKDWGYKYAYCNDGAAHIRHLDALTHQVQSDYKWLLDNAAEPEHYAPKIEHIFPLGAPPAQSLRDDGFKRMNLSDEAERKASFDDFCQSVRLIQRRMGEMGGESDKTLTKSDLESIADSRWKLAMATEYNQATEINRKSTETRLGFLFKSHVYASVAIALFAWSCLAYAAAP